jgi:predicted dehydrogenase
MKTKINIGFVGTGRHARRSIYPSLRWAPIDLVAICNRHGGDVLGDTARKFGAKRTYTNYRKMFEEEDLDAAIIVTGPDSHPQISIDAMRAGLHVFVEKPPANTVKEAMEMAEVSRETGRYLMVAFKKRFAPAYIKAKEIMGSPEFGRPVSIHTRLRSKTSREIVDLRMKKEPINEYERRLRFWILDYVIHHLDLIRFFMGDVDRIYFESNNASRLPSYAVSIGFKNGTVGTMHVTQGDSVSTFQENLEIVGQGANLIVDNVIKLSYYRKMTALPTDQYIGTNEEAPLVWKPAFSLSSAVRVPVLEGFVGEIQHFAESILKGKPPSSNINDGIESLKLVYAMYSKPGKTAYLDEI